MASSVVIRGRSASRSLTRILSIVNKDAKHKVCIRHCSSKPSETVLRHASTSVIKSSSLRPVQSTIFQVREFQTSLRSHGVKEVKTPPFADSITEGDIQYQKGVGDAVAVDECVAEIETEKTSIPVLSPCNGTITELCFESGDTVTANQVLFKVEEGAAPAKKVEEKPKPAAPKAEAPKAAPPPPPKAAPAPTPAAPAPPKPAEQGSIPTSPPPVPSKPAQPSQVRSVSSSDATPPGRTESRVKMTRMRQTIARRLKEAQNTCAMLTTFNEIDMSNVMQMRKQYKEPFEKKHGMKLGFMSAFVKASAYALQELPAVNGAIDGNEIVYRDYVDISVAVATPKGLVIPVLRNVENMNFADIERELNALALKARNNEIAIEDMSGGTFSISNGGVFGSLFGTPIINPPQSAILGMHGINDRPVAIQGKGKEKVVEIRPMMVVALTYDHRLIDGREGVTFLRTIKNAVEDPRVMFLDL